MHSQMQAQEWALASLWENIGMLGPSLETGNPRAVTLDGLKQSPSSFSPAHSHHYSARTTTSSAMVTTQELSKGGGKAPARTPRPTSSLDGYTSSQKQQESTFTHGMCLASTTQQMPHQEESLDHPAAFFPLSPSPALSCPSFKMCQTLQLGLGTSSCHPSHTSHKAMLNTNQAPTGITRDSARNSSQPQPHGVMPSCLQALLTKNMAQRQQATNLHCYDLFFLFLQTVMDSRLPVGLACTTCTGVSSRTSCMTTMTTFTFTTTPP